jgi:hypothetical protein
VDGVEVAVADAEDDEDELADVELLADELELGDDGGVLGEDVGLDLFLGVELLVVLGTVVGDSTVLGVGLVVAG